MTYPQYTQPQAPQGYPQAPGPGYQVNPHWGDPQHPNSQAPWNPAPQYPPVAAPAQGPQFAEPTVGNGEPTVAIRNLAGRAVAITALTIDENAKGLNAKPGDPPRPTVTCNIAVVDGGPLDYADDFVNRGPCTLRTQTPCEFANVMVSNTNVVRSLRPFVGTGQPVIGRIVQGITQTQGNSRPWNLVPLDPADPARGALAQYFGQRVVSGPVAPTAEPINGGPQPKPGQPIAHQAQPAYAPQPAAGPVPQVQYAPPAQPVAPPPANDSEPPPGWSKDNWRQVVASMGEGPARQMFGQSAQPVATAAGY